MFPTYIKTQFNIFSVSSHDESDATTTSPLPKYHVAENYRLVQKIGSGSFGDVYKAYNSRNGEEVAVKLESATTERPLLASENTLYNELSGSTGIPRVRWFGQESRYYVLVMDLLGSSLEDLFNYCGRKFSLKTVLMLANQLLNRIELLHNHGIIHRDIKPENVLMGLGGQSHVAYMIDFGLSKRYRDVTDGTHIPYRSDLKGLTGTPRYASINAQMGIEQSRRDDLETLGYILLYFLRGSLPWQSLKAATKQRKLQKICVKKRSIPVEVLCKGFPEEFATYLYYCKRLDFTQEPDYDGLKDMFAKLYSSNDFENDNNFDWTRGYLYHIRHIVHI